MRAFRAPTIISVVVLAIVVLAIGSSSAAADSTNPATTTVLTVSPTSTAVGDPVTLTATVTGTGANPPGIVRFDASGPSGSTVIGSATLAPVPGSTTTSQASLVTTSFAAGTYAITATYSSTDPFNFFGSASPPATLTVSSTSSHATTVSLAANPTTVVTGQPETFTAVVARSDGTTPSPTGTVTFNDNSVLLGTAPLNASGVATLTVSGFIAGNHSVVALYSGDAANLSSASPPITFSLTGPGTAVQTTTTVSAAPSRIVAGQLVVVSAHVVQTGHTTSPPAGNTVLFYANGILLGDAPLDGSGNASLTVNGWLTGSYVITASYVGDINNLPSTGTLNGPLTVQPTATPLTVTAPSVSSVYGSAIPTLTPTYTGFVGGDTAASLTTQATCTTTATSASTVGAYPVTCSGASSPLYTISYVGGTVTVLTAPLTVTANDASGTAGQPIPALTATITGFKNGQTLATSGVTGSPSCTTTATTSSPAGSYPIVCTQGTLAATNYRFTFVAGTLTLTSSAPPVTCAGGRGSDDGHHDGDRRSSHCESLLADPSTDQNATVSAGQKLTIVYTDETPIGTGARAPTALLSNGQLLAVTVTATSRQPLRCVNDDGGSPSGRYQSLLTFRLPSDLAPGKYSILVTAYDSDGDLDQYIWKVKVGRSSGHDDNDDDRDWQSIFGRLLVGLGWTYR